MWLEYGAKDWNRISLGRMEIVKGIWGKNNKIQTERVKDDGRKWPENGDLC